MSDGLRAKAVRHLCRVLSPWTARFGFVLSPLHFYFPIPDVRELAERGVWDQRSALAGVDWNLEGQLAFLQGLARHGAEANWEEDRQDPPVRYSPHSVTFGFASAMLAHAVVRHARPRRVVEVGCGWSTLVLREALTRNAAEGAPFLRFTGIDPYPPPWLAPWNDTVQFQRVPVQDANREPFRELESGDVLFIDSTHVLNPGSDVQLLYLDVLPRLAPGVYVHIHDIQLPWEYPRAYAEQQRWFWNEQYLLQAFLAHNVAFEIVAAGHWLCREKPEELRAAFPHYDPARHEATGSFWMRRR